MRSRYSAFALGLGEYLVDTLSSDHDDRAVPRATLVRELSRVKASQRFMGLEILSSRMEADRGEVTFRAKIFEKGQDRSFTEHSHFVREDGEWRYAFGEQE
jgi:SEC-C motif domain protein